MPATSQKQQKAMAIAEHDPSKLYSRNSSLLDMSHSQLHDFASTPRSTLPTSAGQSKGLRKLAQPIPSTTTSNNNG